MITIDFATKADEAEFETYFVETGFQAFAVTTGHAGEVEAVMVSPANADGITLTGADGPE